MKKEKLSDQDKAEIRKEKKAWSTMIRMLKKKGALISQS